MSAPAPRRGQGREPARIAADQIAQLGRILRAPDSRHAHIQVDQLVTVAWPALRNDPGLAAYLEEMPGRGLAHLCVAFSQAIGVPVAWVGGLYDQNGKNHDHAGNGWAKLLRAIRPDAYNGVPCANTARRAWAEIEDEGLGGRKERNGPTPFAPAPVQPVPPRGQRARRRRAAPKVAPPRRGRKSGEAFPSADREYTAFRTRSVAYVSASLYRTGISCPFIRRLADALQPFIPKHVRAAARQCASGQSYRWQVARSKAEARSHRSWKQQHAKWRRRKARAETRVISKDSSFERPHVPKDGSDRPSRPDAFKPRPDGPGSPPTGGAQRRVADSPSTAAPECASREGGPATALNPIPPGAARRAVHAVEPEWRAPWEVRHGSSSRR